MPMQYDKPKAPKCTLDKLDSAVEVTNRGQNIEDMQSSMRWEYADIDYVEGNLEGKYEGE